MVVLSVVIPTRNRPRELRRLLTNLACQSLPADRFEAVVVDDGSRLPVPIDPGLPFRVRLVRRDRDHGAHASRRAGLLAASGERVLFLDDDVVPESQLLSAHVSAEASGRIGLGPIAYHAAARDTPYGRYMARYYDGCNAALLRDKDDLPPDAFYICNSSAPRELFLRAFRLLDELHPAPVTGGGYDESLIAEIASEMREAPVCLDEAMLWHVDTKTLAAGCFEARTCSEATANALRDGWFEGRWGLMSGNAGGGSVRGVARRAIRKCYWHAPGPFRLLAAVLQCIAERGPAALVPAWTCRIPLTVARWEGWRRTFPAYREFAGLVDFPKGATHRFAISQSRQG